MQKAVAWIALGAENLLLLCHLQGQRLVTFREVRAMFGGGDYPDDVWHALGNVDSRTTREQLVDRLRSIANRNCRGAEFAAAVR